MAWQCLAYCLMGNHYHLLVRLTEPNLAAGMCLLNGVYAKRFNRRHGCRDHLFGRRYHAERVERDEHLRETVRYIALNPVRAGLCPAPRSWRWSSYRAAAGLEAPPRFLALDELYPFFADTSALARRRFVAFVADAPRAVPGTEPRERLAAAPR